MISEEQVAEEVERIERTGELGPLCERIKDIRINSEVADCKPGDHYSELCDVLGEVTLKAITVLKSRQSW